MSNYTQPKNQNDCPSGTYFKCGCETLVNEPVPSLPRSYVSDIVPDLAPRGRSPPRARSPPPRARSPPPRARSPPPRSYVSDMVPELPPRGRSPRARSPRRARGTSPEPTSQDECPQGTYYRSGYTRDFLGGSQYIKATCVTIPQGSIAAKFNYRRSPRR